MRKKRKVLENKGLYHRQPLIPGPETGARKNKKPLLSKERDTVPERKSFYPNGHLILPRQQPQSVC